MYKIEKVLNHNAMIVTDPENNRGYLIMGKGAGFGKKVNDKVEARVGDAVYSLQESTERGNPKELVNSIEPVYLEIANEILDQAEHVFKDIDRSVIFPMADHIEFAVKRIQKKEQISNPLTDDIRILFHMEFKTAEIIRSILKERMNIEIDDDEIGYIALHIHSAIRDEKVSQAMQMARAVRECISLVEQEVGKPIDVMSLSYNRLMNHVRNMVARALSGEKLKMNINDYMSVKFPHAFQTAKVICEQVGHSLRCTLGDAEIGYLAMHIERVATDELESQEE